MRLSDLDGEHHRLHLQGRLDWEGLWAILWRSAVFLPYMLLMFVCIGSLWLGRWLLPIYGAVLLFLQEWWQSASAFALWLLVFWVYRRFRIRRFLEAPRSLL
jgi:hypothetical protein